MVNLSFATESYLEASDIVFKISFNVPTLKTTNDKMFFFSKYATIRYGLNFLNITVLNF